METNKSLDSKKKILKKLNYIPIMTCIIFIAIWLLDQIVMSRFNFCLIPCSVYLIFFDSIYFLFFLIIGTFVAEIIYAVVNKIKFKDMKKIIFKKIILDFIALFIYLLFTYAFCLVADKPILYLYPEERTNISVTMERSDLIISSYPKYNDGWDVLVEENGDMHDYDGKYYYALYWDERQLKKVDFSDGFYVEGDKAIEFLEDKMTIIGLNDRERNEFIMYWLPIFEKNKRSLVYFELTDELEEYNKLNISPKPDSLLRIRMHIKKVNHYVNIKDEELTSFNRNGYTAVEWGGVKYN